MKNGNKIPQKNLNYPKSTLTSVESEGIPDKEYTKKTVEMFEENKRKTNAHAQKKSLTCSMGI